MLSTYELNPRTSRLDFTNATEEDLAHLAQSCDPATFGLNHEDVLDESYRKAGKLDANRFLTAFNLETSGLLDVVGGTLLERQGRGLGLRAERYKINVYGKHSLIDRNAVLILQYHRQVKMLSSKRIRTRRAARK